MIRKDRMLEAGNTIIYVDSYENGVLQGRFRNAHQDLEHFDSLTQFLIKMDAMLEDIQSPQAYTSLRTFSTLFPPDSSVRMSPYSPPGAKATFRLQIHFRQHTSWQGVLLWAEKNMVQSFRSVLELILLIDSALRSMERSEAV